MVSPRVLIRCTLAGFYSEKNPVLNRSELRPPISLTVIYIEYSTCMHRRYEIIINIEYVY